MKASSNCDRVLIIGAHDSCVLSIDKCRCRKKYSENMASLEGQQENYSNNPAVENIPKRPESREGSAERKASKDREEKLRYARDRQNEERQKKIEELRAQAEAAQKYREQKEEERRRRIEEIRVRDTEKRHQVEERKKAIIEAEKERREFILKKNQERESRIETKRRDRNSIAFAFGSSTPRLLDVPADYGLVSPSTFWSQRRSTSISNVAGASLSRRSSERELADSGAKKRASSSTDRHDEDNVDTTQNMMFRSVYRRKTDLMPTIPSPRDGHYGSRSSLSTTPRTPGRAYSMNRLDQLAQPIRRNGEHVRAILERERRERELEMLDETSSLGGGSTASSRRAHLRGKRAGSASVGASGTSSAAGIMSRSMTHLAAGGGQRERGKYSLGGGISTSFRPLGSGPRDSSSRSGNVTPGGHGHLSGSRPGSAMSTSTTLSTAGPVTRRPATAPRKPRPASIAGTGMSLEEINKLKRDNKPPMKTTTTTNAASPTTSTAQTTPKRTPNLMSTSMIVTSSSTRMHSAEKKTPQKRETLPPKAASASRAQPSRTASMERINRRQKESATKSAASAMSASMIVTSSTGSVTTAAAVVPAPTPEANGVVKEPEELAAKLVPVPDAALAAVSKAEKEALNTVKTEQVQQQELVQIEAKTQPEPEPEHQTEPAAVAVEKTAVEPTAASLSVEEKADEGNEKVQAAAEPIVSVPKKALRNGSKENSEVRELTPPTANLSVDSSNDLMTASMIAKKITTEEEAKAALAERRRLAREEAERQAELERQRLEAERLAELKAQEEEAERQRLFEEESTRLAEEQRRGEEERLRKAIEEAQQREEEEQRRREEEERQRIEREEAEKKAKEEAEKQRIEVAERLKREEKEREERRKRVEAIMSRTRKGGAAATTPAKESADTKAVAAASSAPKENDVNSSSSNSTDGSPSSSSTINDAPAPAAETETDAEPPNSQAMYEQSVLDKENSLINSFANMIIDENAKNLHQFEVSNGKLHVETIGATTPAAAAAAAAVANGNGHIENVNNKNDINLLQDAVTPAVTQLIDLSIESQQDLHINNNNNNNNNNNSLLTSTAANNTLVTADSHENKDISLL
ncbi:inner centromere protein A isoform X3 [Drosophila novamexicana]|uniref:inner centromere protein A isoform X3 n=1 Tax=Drosophila novamexicana TaxID=47314 RepID=UPI0011E5A34D|nr:inner centromere protein A isoform X3 [Drosophila novamexicana]